MRGIRLYSKMGLVHVTRSYACHDVLRPRGISRVHGRALPRHAGGRAKLGLYRSLIECHVPLATASQASYRRADRAAHMPGGRQQAQYNKLKHSSPPGPAGYSAFILSYTFLNYYGIAHVRAL
jgi:hypothetical protein